MEVVLLNQISKKQKNLMVSSQMFSPNRYTTKFNFWIGRPHSRMTLLIQDHTREGVTKLLKGLNPSKALGSNELLNRVLKELEKELGPVFAYLFQQPISTGEIPKEWSLANLCPLFKKGDRSLARNYLPVSLMTCIPSKLLEHIVCSNIMGHLDQYDLLSDKQHAFRKWHSCETQLIIVINDWAKILDKEASG